MVAHVGNCLEKWVDIIERSRALCRFICSSERAREPPIRFVGRRGQAKWVRIE